MNQLSNLLERLNRNQTTGFSLIRIFLGGALFIRGWILVTNPDALLEILREDNVHMWLSYITMGHLIGGFCLATGILTRLAALIQIPILIGAVSVSAGGLMMGGQSLELAALVLFLLVVFFIFGSGNIALSSYLNRKKSGSHFADSDSPLAT